MDFAVCSSRGKQLATFCNLRDAFLATFKLLGSDPSEKGWLATLVLYCRDQEKEEKVATISWSKDKKMKIIFEPCSIPGFHWGYSFLSLFRENCYNHGFKAHDIPVEEGMRSS